MKNNSRRSFLRNSSFALGGLMLVAARPGSKKDQDNIVTGCAPEKTNFALSGTISSVQSGLWSNPATWGGKVPASSDTPLIASGHTITYDLTLTTVAGINVNVGGTLQFDPYKSVTLQTTKNVIIQGKFQMKPGSSTKTHILSFTGVEERNFVGGGMTPLSSDVGLWVMGSGQLDLVGATKKAWTRVNDSVPAGANILTTTETPVGWALGDEIFIVPTDMPTYGDIPVWDPVTGFGKNSFLSKFERKKIIAISGNTVTLSSPLSYAHKKITTDTGKTFTAEVGNLSRNVRIEGTASGKTHVFISSSAVHTIKNISLRYVGPRKDANGDGVTDMVPGRYGLHFHHCKFASKGTVVENCVVYDAGNHAYVPHVSHGIVMRNNISFNTIQTAFWWDFQHLTHDTVWEGNLIAACYGIPRTIDTTDESGERNAGGVGVGMNLAMGDGNIANKNVVVYGGVGDEHSCGGFSWESDNEGVWTFENNLAHSNDCGLRVWQNTSKNHTIINYNSYNNYLGIFHGAYTNSYTYQGGYHYNSRLEQKAASGNSSGVRYENLTFDGAGSLPFVAEILPSPAPSLENHDLFLKCTFKNYTGAAVRMNTFPISGETVRKHVDLALCLFSGKQTEFSAESTGGSFFRIQPVSGQATKVQKSVSPVTISPYVSNLWGTGMGLTAHYYNGSNFESLAFSRIDSVIMFTQWKPDPIYSPTGVDYRIANEKYSVRWTGKVQAQFSEAYTFRIMGATGYRLWIDGKLIIDSWYEKADVQVYNNSSPVNLVSGQFYDIKLECFNTAFPTNCSLFWKCANMDMFRLVPQAQLYPATGIITAPEPATNLAPIANAGADITLTLPTNITTLNGSASRDADGSIRAYRWMKISGPSQYTIANATAATTGLSNLVQGIYVFQLQVTDSEGEVHTDNVVVTVNANLNDSSSTTATLTLTASPNPTSSNTRITVESNVSGSIIIRIYDRFGVMIFSQTNLASNSTITVGDGAPSGTYIVEAIQGTIKKSISILKL